MYFHLKVIIYELEYLYAKFNELHFNELSNATYELFNKDKEVLSYYIVFANYLVIS